MKAMMTLRAARAWWWADPVAAATLGLGFAALVMPTLWRLAHWVWPTDEQGHGPLVLVVSVALMIQRWPEARSSSSAAAGGPDGDVGNRARGVALGLIFLALLAYAFGRSQAILMAEVGSLILLTASLVLLHLGWAGVRTLVFPLAFLLFMIPLPEALVAAVTAPMKMAVSTVAAWALQAADQPVARSGVMLTAGPYQLLVADACAGLNTLFTLEALGLLYLHLRGHDAWWHNAIMAVLVVPIAFTANVLRVITLVMVTLVWGDAAGQGYAHGLAGMSLFLAALLLLLAADTLVGMAAALWRRWVLPGGVGMARVRAS
jgi:exosortase B